jgi:hypothetical protein
MIISDLSYATVLDADVVGGSYAPHKPKKPAPRYVNTAYLDAYAFAGGYNTKTKLVAYTETVYGLYSESSAIAYSESK